ncbi:hypothetical protein DBR27_01710 [Flavobacterium sp. HMWF030]|nr:hypothetical protein DBR27_01710 [Flavobacterium sp. HMWF030]
MKNAFLPLVCVAFLFTACGNTQKQDKENEAEKTEQAANSVDSAAQDAAMSDANATNAVVETIQANIDNAMSKVALPTFKKENAKIFAELFHKDLSELVNANSTEKANKYIDKLTNLKKDYEKKAAKEKFDAGDKKALDKYVNDLINAVQNAN